MPKPNKPHGRQYMQIGRGVDTTTKAKESEYLKRGHWRCEKSPSGAHYTINISEDAFVCQYCDAVFHWPLSQYADLEVES